MNWEAIQAIAELGAAVAVLASLVYLAAQVRQNTVSVQSSTVARSSEILNRIRNHLWVEPDAIRIYYLALSGAPIEDPADRGRARLFLVALARDYEAMFYQHGSGQLPDDIWDSWRREMLLVFTTPGGRDAVEGMSGTLLSSDFAVYLRALLDTTEGSTMEVVRARWTEAGETRRAREVDSQPG